jgi:hypothetical protein
MGKRWPAVKWYLRGAVRVLGHGVRRPGDIIRHRRWVLRRVGIDRLLHRSDRGRVIPVSPGFEARHCQPMMHPRTVPAAQADHMRDDDVVLGTVLGGSARAYPWWIMDDHHMANDVVGGQPVTIVLCEMCSTGIAVDPVVDGMVLTFQQRHIYNGTITMDDYQTNSVWSPVATTAVEGKLKGAKLDMLPLWQMEWRAWREIHPDTDVLAPELGSRTGHGSDHDIGSPRVQRRMRESMLHWDDRLPHNTLAVAVSAPGGSRAYPLEALRQAGGVVNDEVGGHPVVIIHPMVEGNYSAAAFSRQVDGTTLTFQADGRGVLDRETGSVWSPEGRALDGPLAGTELPFVPSHVSEWYIVATSYPEIDIFRRPG